MPNLSDIENLVRAPLEDVLLKLYPATFLRWLYDICLRELAAAHPELLPQVETAQRFGRDKTPRKDYLIALTLAVLNDKTLVRQLLDALPPTARAAIAYVTWEKQPKLAVMEADIGAAICALNPDERRVYYEPFLLAPEHGFLCIVNENRGGWYYYGSHRDKPGKDRYCAVLPDAVRRVFSAAVPPPPDYELLPIETLPGSPHRYACGAKAIGDIRLVAEFIAQGHLKYTKAERVSTQSLRSLRELTGGPEFFDPIEDKDLDMLRTRLLVGGVASAGAKQRAQVLARTDSAEPLRALFESLSANAVFLHEELLAHLGGGRNGEWEYNARHVKALASFFAKFPSGQWVSIANMRRYHALRERMPSLFHATPYALYGRLVHVDESWVDSVHVDDRNETELVGVPLLKGYAFLLAALGLADIAYDPPQGATYRLDHKAYLTPFDGLRFVRLTPLGECVVGQRGTYDVAADAAPSRAVITLDETRLLATCRGADALTELTLGQFMEKLAPDRYRMTHQTLLRGCASQQDLEERIRLFRRAVSAKPPALWTQFFEKNLARISPLDLEPEYVVLKINADDDLRRLLSSDPVLRSLALRVEGLRIAVRRTDLRKLAKRLEQFGYLSPLPRAATAE